MNPWEWNRDSIPDDIALHIASSLKVSDVCALGSCSRLWRKLCSSDYIWLSLSRNRWPSLDFSKLSSASSTVIQSSDSIHEEKFSSAQGWRSFYIRRHDEMASRAAVLIKFVESCSQSKSLEVHDYLRSIQILCSMDMVFKDIVMFLFASKQNVLLNLIGLHYSMFQLGVPVTDVIEALSDCNILEREVCVKWWKLGRWLYGFRMRDEFHSRKVFLGHLALTKEDEVFGVLHRGAIHEVLRVQIFVADVIRTPWSFKNVHQPA